MSNSTGHPTSGWTNEVEKAAKKAAKVFERVEKEEREYDWSGRGTLAKQ